MGNTCSTYRKKEIQSKVFAPFVDTLPDQKNKVVVITGTTTGTGYTAALVSAQKGATVALLNRKSDRSAAAIEQLKKEVPTATIHSIECDLMSFESVRNAANELKLLFPNGIDVLCNNAGIMMFDEIAGADGYDCQMTTNHLSHFLLTKELFPLLKMKSLSVGEARVVNHSSEARRGIKFDAKYYEKLTTPAFRLGGNTLNGRVARYGQSKFANAVFTNALLDKINANSLKVKAYCAHPGLATTDLQVTTAKHTGPGCMTCILNMLFSGLAGQPQSQEDGSVGILKCMFEPNLSMGGVYGPSDSHWMSGPAVQNFPDKAALGADLTDTKQKFWKVSEEACGTVFQLE